MTVGRVATISAALYLKRKHLVNNRGSWVSKSPILPEASESQILDLDRQLNDTDD